eukprot:scaffold146_cov171-Ochromonas_danica.AAC.30
MQCGGVLDEELSEFHHKIAGMCLTKWTKNHRWRGVVMCLMKCSCLVFRVFTIRLPACVR